ncbi:MAG TPA: phosphate ABC transporter permease PstA [Trueperaceae bacterium]|nr:phosphate ABC transporter permease PstA [Trueperaceae bacterium]
MSRAGAGDRAPLPAPADRPERPDMLDLGGVEARRRRRRVRAFEAAVFVPVLLALALLATLFFDVITDSFSWQVIAPHNSGRSFAFAEGFAFHRTWENVVRLELLAQGRTPEEADALLADPEARRLFAARNRVELMPWVDGLPLRWLVTSSRDDHVADLPLFEGVGRRRELLASAEPGQVVLLNAWLDWSFFLKNASRSPAMAGLLPALVGSLMLIALVILLAVPLGVGTAVYLEEYAGDTPFSRLVELNLSNLAGVPSVVYGILGLSVFVRLLGLGPVILAGALTLTLLVVPVVVVAAREAIRSVPDSLRQAAYGLGATRSQVVFRVVLPGAVSGITTGVILAVARALGETAPLLVIGAAAFVPRPPAGPLSPFTAIPIQVYNWVSENDVEFTHVASAAIVVLLLVLGVLYSLAFYLRRRYESRW